MPQSSTAIAKMDLADLAQWLLEERLRRARFFDTEMFAEAGWNIMLDLFIARAKGRELTVSDACLCSGVPSATAKRWLQKLTGEGLVVRREDGADGRRVYVDLSQDGLNRMTGYLAAMDLRPLACRD